jgi:hypothetical protein
VGHGKMLAQESKLVLIKLLALDLTLPFTVHQISMLFVPKKIVKIGATDKESVSKDDATIHKIFSRVN